MDALLMTCACEACHRLDATRERRTDTMDRLLSTWLLADSEYHLMLSVCLLLNGVSVSIGRSPTQPSLGRPCIRAQTPRKASEPGHMVRLKSGRTSPLRACVQQGRLIEALVADTLSVPGLGTRK